VLANPYQYEVKARGIRVAEWSVALKVDLVLVKQSLSGRGPVYVFREAGVELRETQTRNLTEALSIGTA